MRTGDRCDFLLFSNPCPLLPSLWHSKATSFPHSYASCSLFIFDTVIIYLWIFILFLPPNGEHRCFFKKSVHLSVFLCRSDGKGQDNVFHCEPKFPTQHRGWLTSLWTIQYWGGLPATALIQCEVPLPAISTIQFPTVFDTAPRVFPKSNLKKQCQFMSFSQQIHCSGDQNIQIVHVT